MKLIKILKKTRVMILLAFLIISFIAINPKLSADGVAIKGIEKNSAAELGGIAPPKPGTPQTGLERIIEIDGEKISNIEGYNNALSKINLNSSLKIKTNLREYALEKDSEDLGLTVQNAEKSNIRKGLELQGGTRVVLKPEKQISDQERSDLISTMENRLNVYGLSDLKI